jgi:hypothetical protein
MSDALTINEIANTLCRWGGVSWLDVVERRTERAVLVRGMIALAAHEMAGKSYPEIGQVIGRPHNSALRCAARMAGKCDLAGRQLDAAEMSAAVAPPPTAPLVLDPGTPAARAAIREARVRMRRQAPAVVVGGAR